MDVLPDPRSRKAQPRATPRRRDWFLVDSSWSDELWLLRPTNQIEEGKQFKIAWNFALGNGDSFTDPQYSALLEKCRTLIALIREQSILSRQEQRASTTVGYFTMLRLLIRWMVARKLESFGALSDLDVRAYRSYLKGRDGVKRANVSAHTVLKHLYLLTYLYRYAEYLGDGLRSDPLSGDSAISVSGAQSSAIRAIPYTPPKIAIRLVNAAIKQVEQVGECVLQARAAYIEAAKVAKARGVGRDAIDSAAERALSTINTQNKVRIESVSDLADAIDCLYAACFVCLSYLTGARVSEILHLEVGCARPAQENKPGRIVGAIYKQQQSYTGKAHEWIAPPAAIKAVDTLEKLSLPHRAKNGTLLIWIRRSSKAGSREWLPFENYRLAIPSGQRMNDSLRRFATRIGLEDDEGRQWSLSSHQGRKTFARFVALRDRTALFALAQQLGHRERGITDTAYSGHDYRLKDEIDAEVLQESIGAWEEMLASPHLAGKAGVEVTAKRPRFQGVRVKEEITSYAKLLVDAGLVLGVCDWGYCVYRQRASACGGGVAGPNPIHRTPSVCATCSNFAVAPRHADYWRLQMTRSLELAQEPRLPRQTRELVNARVREAEHILSALQEPNRIPGSDEE